MAWVVAVVATASCLALIAERAVAAGAPSTTTVIGGTGGGPATGVAQNPVSLALEPGGGLAVGDGTAMVVRHVSGSGVETDVACAGDIATSGYGGDGGPATDASCDGPDALVVDPSGDLYLADDQNDRVRVVASHTGTFFGTSVAAGAIDTVAGDGVWGGLGDGGPAASAELAYPAALALDGAGNLVVADSGNNQIRVVAAQTGLFYGQSMVAGDIYTVAGTGTPGHSGDGGPAIAAELDQPAGLAVDGHGNLVIGDLGSNEVRVLAARTGTFYGQSMVAGDLYTIAGTGTAGSGGDGGPARAAELDMPQGVAVDGRGDVLVADSGNNRVRVVAEHTGTLDGTAVLAGDMATVAGNGTPTFSGDGGPAVDASLSAPTDVVVDHRGDLFVADAGNNRVRVVGSRAGTVLGQGVATGTIETVAGDGVLGGASGNGGRADQAELNLPTGVAADQAGDVAVADQNDQLVRFVPGRSGTDFGQEMTAGRLYTVAGDGAAGLGGTDVVATRAALDAPSGVAFDRSGNLVVAAFADNRLFVVAARDGTFYGQAMTAGDLYAIAGSGALGSTGDGRPALHGELDAPEDVAVDGAGNVIFSEFYGNRIRVVAEATGTSYGIHMRAGDLYTVAGTGAPGWSGDGGPARQATFQQPVGVAVDHLGNLVVGDFGNDRVRIVAASSGTDDGMAMVAGDVYTLAGDGVPGESGDGGPAPQAELDRPAGVAVDRAGDVVISDSGNGRIRWVAARSGELDGQAMVAGHIYSVAGGGTLSCASGDVRPQSGAAAALSAPLGVAVAGSDRLEIADTGNNCVRQLLLAGGTADDAPAGPSSGGQQ